MSESANAREYAVLVEAVLDENGAVLGYSAYVPDLPGCIAAGETAEETEQLIREGIELHIESLREHGDPVPQPTTRVLTVTAG